MILKKEQLNELGIGIWDFFVFWCLEFEIF